jgi:hypothetical protein
MSRNAGPHSDMQWLSECFFSALNKNCRVNVLL